MTLPKTRPTWWRALAILAGGLAAVWFSSSARACPFCNAVSKTLSEEIASSDAVVLAKLVQGPAKAEADNSLSPEAAQSTFEIAKVLKGADILGKTRQIKVLFFGQQPKGSQFLLFGVDPKNLAWTTPTPLDDRSAKYVAELISLPEKGADRLAFFQDYLEDSNSMLATDAYDEFARAPYADVKELGKRMHHDKLLAWVKNLEVPSSRRRLYFTMLGICGQPDDVAVLEEMLNTNDRQVRTALDAMIACYIILKGPDGMPLVEELFLKNKDAEYTDTYAAIMALRFLGQESNVVSKERLLKGLRYMLDRPQLADLVIPDLARWQDWSVIDKLATLFKEANDESSWVRVPVVNYLRACPKPEAKERLAELAKIDPDAVKRANSFFPLGTASPAKVASPDKAAEDKAADKKPASSEKPSKSTGTKSETPPAKTGAQLTPADAGDELAALDDSQILADVSSEESRPRLAAAPVASAANASAVASNSATRPKLKKKPAQGEASVWELIGVSFGAGAALFALQWAILRNNRQRMIG
jgi:hypothetical protein